VKLSGEGMLVRIFHRGVGPLPVLDEMVGDGLVTTERVHVVTYRGSAPEG